MEFVVKRLGNKIELSSDTPITDAAFLAEFHAKFSYTRLVPSQAYGTAKLQAISSRMFLTTDRGGLISFYGILPAVREWFRSQGVRWKEVELTPEDKNALLLKPDWSRVDTSVFRPRQEACLRACIEGKHGIIQAPTGFGKTFLISQLLKLYPTARFHCCTQSVDVARRMYKSFLEVTPDVGVLGAGRHDQSCRVTIIVAASLERSDGKADFFIYDECHQAAAPTISQAIVELYPYSRNYGFTATPTGRSDKADGLLQLLFGSVLFSLGYQDSVNLGLVVPVTVRWLKCDQTPVSWFAYRHQVAQMRNCIWRNRYRNSAVAEDIKTHYTNNEQILVLVATIEHALELRKYLPDFELVYGSMNQSDLQTYIHRGLLPEDYTPLSSKQRSQLQEKFRTGITRRVIATDVWNTGVDFPELNVVYNVTGRASKILTTQGGGRVSRLFYNKPVGIVVDIADVFDCSSTRLYKACKTRYAQYKSLGWRQEGFPGIR